MAARQSTASQKRRTSKQTKPKGERIKPTPRRERKQSFGLMIGDTIVARHAKLTGIIAEGRRRGEGQVVAFMTKITPPSPPTTPEENERQYRRLCRNAARRTNPLADKLSDEHRGTLRFLADLLGETSEYDTRVEICLPFGRVPSTRKGGDGYTRATDDEAAMADVEVIGINFKVDTRGDIAQQILDGIDAFHYELGFRMEQIKLAMKLKRVPVAPVTDDAVETEEPAAKVSRRGKAVPA